MKIPCFGCMRRKTILLLAFLLLLSGCAPREAGISAPSPGPAQAADTPAPELEPDPESSLFPEKESGPVSEPAEVPAASPALTRDYFQAKQIEVDADHSFWVELTETPEDSPLDYDLLGGNGEGTVAVRVNIYRKQTDERPVQSFLDGYSCETGEMELCGHDYNFDGYEDFSFVNMHFGFRYCGYAHYIWDKQAEQFVQDPYGLNRLTNRGVHEEEQVITSYSSAAGGSESYWHHRYVDGELTVTRKCSVINPIMPEDGGFHIQVEDLVDGKWEQVYWSDKYEDESGVYRLWRNGFDYHGEGAELLAKQPIDDTHDFFTVPTGGRLGTLLVTVEVGPAKYDGTLNKFSVWSKDDLTTPIQAMEAEAYQVLHWSDVVDVNFDGYMDFGYMYAMGNQPQFYHFWIWDEEQGLFVAEPEFDEISCPQFDPETGTITGNARGGAAGLAGVHTLHQWIDGKLDCVRKITTEPRWTDGGADQAVLMVEEPADGTLTEVFRKTAGGTDILDEVVKWLDLSYHGET